MCNWSDLRLKLSNPFVTACNTHYHAINEAGQLPMIAFSRVCEQMYFFAQKVHTLDFRTTVFIAQRLTITIYP